MAMRIILNRNLNLYWLQAPIHVKWERPIWIETVNPAVSGDVGGLEQFGEIDLTKPPVTMEGSPELAAAPPEVRRVLSLEFAR